MPRVFVYHDSQYAPCGFLIVREGANPYDDQNTVLVQTDWDFPSLASNLGYVPCDCGLTDGTVNCDHKTASEMISAARAYIMNHLEELFDDPGYFEMEGR